MNTMKKVVVLLAITVFALTTICSVSYAGKAKLFLTMGTGGIADTYYPFGGIITSMITQQLKDSELGVISCNCLKLSVLLRNLQTKALIYDNQ